MNQLSKDQVYHAAVYVRLSKEDGDKEESDSIVNQKELIRAFLADKPEVCISGEFVDDGYSGADFNRPSFKRMVSQIEAGQIDCVVVKDLSRFGRNFVETGRYIDQIFPAMGIRFIAVNDHYDSINGRTSSDRILIPFKNLINGMYSKDISVKVKSARKTRERRGEYLNGVAFYGYRRDPADRHHLLVDEEVRWVVKAIFTMSAQGMSTTEIAKRLNEQGIPYPVEYRGFLIVRSWRRKKRSGFKAQ